MRLHVAIISIFSYFLDYLRYVLAQCPFLWHAHQCNSSWHWFPFHQAKATVDVTTPSGIQTNYNENRQQHRHSSTTITTTKTETTTSKYSIQQHELVVVVVCTLISLFWGKTPSPSTHPKACDIDVQPQWPFKMPLSV